MKNICFALPLLFFVVFAGCKKDLTYTITASASSGGTISPSGVTTVVEGDSITYTITPNASNATQAIKVDGVEQPITSKYKFKNVTTNHEIKAEFIATYAITVTATAGGTVSPSGTVIVKKGETVTLKFTPNVGYSIQSIKVKGVEQSVAETYEFKNVTENSDIKVAFISTEYSLLTKAPWYLKSSEVQEKGVGPWSPLVPEPRCFTDYMVFSLNKTISKYDVNDQIFGGPYQWSTNNGTLTIANLDYKIISLTSEELVLESFQSSNFKDTYTHNKK